MISFPCPNPIIGEQLAAEITAAGFTNVTVSVSGYDTATGRYSAVDIGADGLTDPMPPEEERAACADLEAVDALKADYASRAAASNAAAYAVIGPIVAAHVPVPPAAPTPSEKLAALGLTVADLKAVLA